MLLSKIKSPRSKTDLVKSLTNLRNVEFKIFEDIGRGNSSDIKRELKSLLEIRLVQSLFLKIRTE